MYAWRARLGVLVPSGILAVEPEYVRMVPEGVVCHFNRYVFKGAGSNEEIVSGLKGAEKTIADACTVLMDAHPSVVIMTGTGTSFIGGYGYDQMLIKKLRERAGNLPVTTTSTSVIEALKRLNIKKVSIAMPYIEEVARTCVKFVEDSGISVVKSSWLNLGGASIGNTTKETVYHLAREVDQPDSEAIFISCVGMHAVEVIDKLERDLQKPVVTSNQASMWNVLRLAGIRDKIEGYGQLFTKY